MKTLKIFPVFAALLCALGTGAAAADGNDNFYYHQEGSGVYVDLYGELDTGSESGSDVLLAFYDGDKLIKTEMFETGSGTAGFRMSEVYVPLPYAPEELSMRSFIWAGDGSCAPLAPAADISDIPADAKRCSGMLVNTCKTLSVLNENEVRIKIPYELDERYLTFDARLTDAADHLFEQADFYMTEDGYGNYKLLSFEPKTEGVLSMKLNELELQNYQLSDDVHIYINGTELFINTEEIEEAVSSAKSSNVYDAAGAKLIDYDGDGIYDFVMIDCYSYGIVDSVSVSSEITTIYFSDYSADIKYGMVRYANDDDYITVLVKDRNGNKLSVDDIREGDRLYIQSDHNTSFSDSPFYDITIDDDRAAEPVQPENKVNSASSGLYVKYADGSYQLGGTICIDAQGENRILNAALELQSGGETVYTESFTMSSAMKELNISRSITGLEKAADSGVITVTDTNGNTLLEDTIPVTDGNVSTIYGRIADTSRTDGELLPSQVRILVEEKYDWYYQTATCALTDPDMFMYSRMVLSEKDGEYTLIKATPLRTDNKVTFPASRISEDEYYSDYMITESKIPVYDSEDSTAVTAYRLSSFNCMVRLFVNGAEVDATDDNAYKYLIENPSGSVTLIDETELGGTATDGYYEYIFTDYYEDHVVDSVGADGIYVKDTAEPLQFSDGADIRVFLDGEETDISEIRAGDVLSIARNMRTEFGDSDFYDIYISHDTVSGTVTTVNVQDNTVTINGTEYECICDFDFELATYYKLYLNRSGYVVYAEEYAYDRNYGAVVGMYKSAGDDYATVRLIDKSGTLQTYECRNENEEDNFYTVFNGKDPYEEQLIYDGGSYTKADFVAIENNVCTYTLTSSGIRFVNKLTAVGGELVYSALDTAFGETAIDPQNTSIAVVTDYLVSGSEPFGITADALTDGTVYEVYMYIPDGISGVPFVMITSGGTLSAPEQPAYTEFGLITAMYRKAGDDYATIRFAAPDGSIKEYECYDSSEQDEFYSIITGEPDIPYDGYTITISDMAALAAAVYTVDNERIKFVEVIGALSEGAYSADANSIGEIALTDETKLVYINDSGSSTAITRDQLIDGETYTVYDAAYNGTEAVYMTSGEIEEIPYETIQGTGVVVGIYRSVGNEYPTVRIIDETGEVKTYNCRTDRDADYFFTVYNGSDPYTTVIEYDGGAYSKSDIEDITKNVCRYRMHHTGEVSFEEYLSAEGGTVRYTGTAFGDHAIDPETTAILDIDSYLSGDSSALKVSADMLYINGLYNVYAYSPSDGVYGFVMLTNSVTALSAYTPISIVRSYNGMSVVNGYEYYDYTVLTGSDEKRILTDDYDCYFKEGDAIIYTADSDGIAYNCMLVNESISDYDDLLYDTLSNETFSSVIESNYLPYPDTNISSLSNSHDEVRVYFGPVYEKKDNTLTLLLRQNENMSDTGADTIKFTLNHSESSYIYDYSCRPGKGMRVYAGSAPSIPSTIYKQALTDGGNMIDWDTVTGGYEYPSFAFVKTINGEVTDVIYYIN